MEHASGTNSGGQDVSEVFFVECEKRGFHEAFFRSVLKNLGMIIGEDIMLYDSYTSIYIYIHMIYVSCIIIYTQRKVHAWFVTQAHHFCCWAS